MKAHDAADNCEAKARAVGFGGARFIYPVEPLEYALALLRRYAYAVVLDGDKRLSASKRKLDRNVLRSRVSNSILHKVRKCLLNELRIARHGERRVRPRSLKFYSGGLRL